METPLFCKEAAMTPQVMCKRIKGGRLYECSIETASGKLGRRHQACKELLYDYNHTGPGAGERRIEILRRFGAYSRRL